MAGTFPLVSLAAIESLACVEDHASGLDHDVIRLHGVRYPVHWPMGMPTARNSHTGCVHYALQRHALTRRTRPLATTGLYRRETRTEITLGEGSPRL